MESFLSRRILSPKGFTLIEMLIVLAIIGIICLVVLGGQSGFSRTLGLNNTAYDIGLSIRQAQSYGLSSQAYDTNVCSGTAVLGNTPYGIFFSGSTSYVLFADTGPCPNTSLSPDKAKPGDGQYHTSGVKADVAIKTYSLNNGYTVKDFSVMTSAKSKLCTASGQTTIPGMAITFSRPNAETTILEGSGNTWTDTTDYAGACIEVASAQGDTRFVTISQTGEVQVGNTGTIDTTSCPPCGGSGT